MVSSKIKNIHLVLLFALLLNVSKVLLIKVPLTVCSNNSTSNNDDNSDKPIKRRSLSFSQISDRTFVFDNLPQYRSLEQKLSELESESSQNHFRIGDNITYSKIFKINIPTIDSSLNPEQKRQLKEWFVWKNSINRYDSAFDRIEPKFRPESIEYRNSIKNTGMTYYLFGLGILGLSLIYLFSTLFCLGLFEKKKELDSASENFSKILTYSVLGIGGTFCFCGFIIVFVAGQIHRETLWESTENIRNSGEAAYSNSLIIDKEIRLFNDQIKDGKTETRSLRNLAANFIKIGEIQRNGSSELAFEMDSGEKKIYDSFWLLLVYGFIFTILIVFAVYFKKPNFSLMLGFLFITGASLAFFLGGLYFSQIIYDTDVCEQTSNILNDESPIYGYGYSYYFPCKPDKLARVIDDQKTELISALDFYTNSIFQIFSEFGYKSMDKNIQSFEEIVNVTSGTKLKNAPQITVVQKKIATLLEIFKNTEKIQTCYFQRESAALLESGLCFQGIPFLYTSFIGVLILSAGFLLMGIGAIKAKYWMDSLQEEEILTLRKENLIIFS